MEKTNNEGCCVNLKVCAKCKLEKQTSDFRKEPRTKIGIQSRCKACEAEYYKSPDARERNRKRSAEKLKTHERQEYMRKYFDQPHVKAKKRERENNIYAENKEKIKARNNAWRAANAEKKKGINARWNSNNKASKTANLANYRAIKLKATPGWADLSKIKAFYVEAASKKMHVDHIVPLRGKLVCGLHVHNNLQLLSPSENHSKGNKWCCRESQQWMEVDQETGEILEREA